MAVNNAYHAQPPIEYLGAIIVLEAAEMNVHTSVGYW